MPPGSSKLFELLYPGRDGSTIMYALESEANWGAYEHSKSLKIEVSFSGADCRLDVDSQDSRSEFG